MNLLEKHFDLAFAAPDGIRKLRELILTLAMQGKLVPQDPSDQPASELLRAIEAGKQRLANDGKIKQPKTLPEIKEGELPYRLPSGWEWVRLGCLVNVKSSKRIFESDYCDSGVPFYRSREIGELAKNGYCEDRFFISEAKYSEISKGYGVPKKGDVLLTSVGSIGGCWIVDNRKFYYKDGNVTQLEIGDCVDSSYIITFIGSNIFTSQVLNSVSGTAYNALTIVKIKGLLFPLPPLAEQHRIVAKIDRLMARCDELEKLRAERKQKRIAIHTAALDRLLTAKESSDFSTAWRFITQHFGELYSVKENVAELRKAILQLAVMGKLVPQDPTDEPASELLKAIEVEKERLIKEEKIKRQKALPEIIDEEKDFILPSRWEWARLQNVLDVRDGTHYSPMDATGSDTYPFVTSKNFVNGKIDFSTVRRISAKDHFEFTKRSKVDKLDILFSMIGGNIGNQVIVEDECDFSIKNVALFKYYNKQLTNPYFIKIYLEHLANGLQAKAAGGAQPFVSLAFLRNLVIALPPKEEQSRLVAKTNSLMALCDRLEQQIDAATSKRTELLKALMAQV